MNIAKGDLIAFSGLSEEEVSAIAEHEHIPEVAAAALGHYLESRKGGIKEIREMICEDIRDALARGDDAHATELFMALTQLHRDHGAELEPHR
jgi:hypothetical protein